MANPVVVVDSDAKAKSLRAQFDGDLDILTVLSQPVKASHKPPKDKLKRQKPVFKFAPLPAESKSLDKLVEYLDRDIYLALDCDQRGDYWSWSLSEYLSTEVKVTRTPRRLLLAGLGKDEVREAFRLVAPVREDIATSFYIRGLFYSCLNRHLQRLLGTLTGPGKVPLNYYSLTALFLLADREAELKAYTPPKKWEINVKLVTSEVQHASAGQEFVARLEEVYGVTDDGFFKNIDQGKEIIDRFMGSPFKVKEVKRSDFSIQPPAPYRMVELLHDAHTMHGISPKKVLDTTRKLYHGLDLNGSSEGLISSFVPVSDIDFSGMAEKTAGCVAETFGEEALGEDEEFDFADDCILPLNPLMSENDLSDVLDEEERKIYGLIRSRALAGFMRPATGETVDVVFEASGECRFRASLKSIKDKGFLAVHQGCHEKGLLEPCPLADAKEGQVYACMQIFPEQTGGFPPEYYTVETLYADLADFAVSVDSLSLMMLQSLINSGCVFITSEGYLRCKGNTAKVVATLSRAFPTMAGIALSAYLEQTISETLSGRKPLDFAMKQFDQALLMQGRMLVKASLAAKPRPQMRRRASSSIIRIPSGPSPREQEKKVSRDVKTVPTEHPESLPPEAEAGKVEDVAMDDVKHEELAEQELSPPAPEEESSAVPSEKTATIAEEPEAEITDGSRVEEPDVSPAETEEAAEDAGASLQAEEASGAPEVEEELGADIAPDESGVVEPEESSEVLGEQAAEPEVFDQPEGSREEAFPPVNEQPEQAEKGPKKECPACGKPMILRSDKYGKLWTCTGFPACRHADSYEKKETPQMLCPICSIGSVLVKVTPAGKTFYVCPEQDCEFLAWSQPHAEPCQICNSPFLVEKKDASGRVYLRCPRAGCGYMQIMPGSDGEAVAAAPRPAKKKKKVRVRRKAAGSAGAGGKKKRLVRVVRRK